MGMFVGDTPQNMDDNQQSDLGNLSQLPEKPKKKGCKVMKPRYQIEDAKRKGGVLTNVGMQSLIPDETNIPENPQPQNNPSAKVNSLPKKAVKSWEVLLSESSGSENELEAPRKPKIKEKVFVDKKVALSEHDYCHAIYKMLKEEEKKPEDLSEMDKILS